MIAFPWYWRRLLRVPWTARLSNHSILKEINPDWLFIGRTDAEGEAPTLWPPDMKSQLIWKDPDAGKIERKMRKEWQRMRCLYSITDSMDIGLSKTLGDSEGQGSLVCSPWVSKSQVWLSNRTTTNDCFLSSGCKEYAISSLQGSLILIIYILSPFLVGHFSASNANKADRFWELWWKRKEKTAHSNDPSQENTQQSSSYSNSNPQPTKASNWNIDSSVRSPT